VRAVGCYGDQAAGYNLLGGCDLVGVFCVAVGGDVMIYECTYPGCRHTTEITEHSATPRHLHGEADVEMRKQINIGSLFYNIKPSELKASGGNAAFD